MAKKNRGNLIGGWSFLIGVVLACVIGLFSPSYLGVSAQKTILMILVFLGIIVGLLNVGTKDSSKFMLAGVALVIVSFMGSAVLAIIPQIGAILNALLVLFVPATLIVALKAVFEIGKD